MWSEINSLSFEFRKIWLKVYLLKLSVCRNIYLCCCEMSTHTIEITYRHVYKMFLLWMTSATLAAVVLFCRMTLATLAAVVLLCRVASPTLAAVVLLSRMALATLAAVVQLCRMALATLAAVVLPLCWVESATLATVELYHYFFGNCSVPIQNCAMRQYVFNMEKLFCL